jgi:ATP-dependent Zn protease
LKEISKEEIADALERIVAGPEKKGAVMSEQKKKLVAYHEVRSRLFGMVHIELQHKLHVSSTIVMRNSCSYFMV